MSDDFRFFGHVIDNEEVESLDGARFDVVNPWTRETWARGGRGGARRTPTGRSPRPAGLRRGAVAADGPGRAGRADPPARRPHGGATPTTWPWLDTTDMGKPLTQALHDVARSVLNFRFFADHQRDARGEVLPDGLGPPHLHASTARPASSPRSARGTSR